MCRLNRASCLPVSAACVGAPYLTRMADELRNLSGKLGSSKVGAFGGKAWGWGSLQHGVCLNFFQGSRTHEGSRIGLRLTRWAGVRDSGVDGVHFDPRHSRLGMTRGGVLGIEAARRLASGASNREAAAEAPGEGGRRAREFQRRPALESPFRRFPRRVSIFLSSDEAAEIDITDVRTCPGQPDRGGATKRPGGFPPACSCLRGEGCWDAGLMRSPGRSLFEERFWNGGLAVGSSILKTEKPRVSPGLLSQKATPTTGPPCAHPLAL